MRNRVTPGSGKFSYKSSANPYKTYQDLQPMSYFDMKYSHTNVKEMQS